jgi:glycosyltransferase involved in cell wall biosynthesis
MKKELEDKGFSNLAVWNRGVDRKFFTPKRRDKIKHLVPVMLCVSRASVEKGLDDFCGLKLPGKKILVGDGPYLEELKQKYPTVTYLGYKQGDELADAYANADVFVFPSKSDTFGVVMLESMASGTPIAAYPVTGPIDIVRNGINGYTDDDLEVAIRYALYVDRKKVRSASRAYEWDACTKTFLDNLTRIG